jgi:hypothetical protein
MATHIARRVAAFDDIAQAGDYFLGAIQEDGVSKPMVWFLLPIHVGNDMFDHATPGSGLHGVSSPPWTFRECDDGSLEIRASIACGRGTKDGEYFHGWLNEHNEWTY